MHGEARLRGSIADAGIDAPHNVDPPEVGSCSEEPAVAFRIDDRLQADRHVKCLGDSITPLAPVNPLWSYADDGEGDLVERDGLAHAADERPQSRMPHRVADDCDVSGARRGVV